MWRKSSHVVSGGRWLRSRTYICVGPGPGIQRRNGNLSRKPFRAWRGEFLPLPFPRMTVVGFIAALKALSEETRLRILRLLFRHDLSVNEISDRLRVSQYNVSKHLRIMREAGLLQSEKRGKQRIYSVADDLKSE